MIIIRIIIFIAVFFLLNSSILFAGEFLGIGGYLGLQHEVGNLYSEERNIQLDPQSNFLLGVSFKANIKFIFFRTGADTTFILNKGIVLEDSSTIEKYKIHYTSIPGFLGLRFPIKDVGEFYMGGGCAYIVGTGSINVKDSESQDIQTTVWGFGFITGIEINFLSVVRLFMEWEYIDARSGAVLKTDTTYDWKNFYVDYTGHRLFFGVMYYLI